MPEQQVLLHRQSWKDVAVFRHIANAQMGDLVGLFANNFARLPVDGALAVDQAHDGFGSGRSARAIASQQGHNLAGLHIE